MRLAATLFACLLAAQQPQEVPPDQVAARADPCVLSFAELDALLLGRHAASERGREALRHLLEKQVIAALATEARLSIGEKEVDLRIQKLEREEAAIRQAGGLPSYLRQQGVSLATFREYLRLGLVQETLARRALGIAPDKPVSGDEQQLWLDQVMRSRGLDSGPPWRGEIAARSGDVTVSLSQLALHLRTALPGEDIQADCFQALLEKRLLLRMPDLAPEALEAAIQVELARRRDEAARDPRFKGLAYEQVMAAGGIAPDFLTRDPAVRCAALAHVWVDKKYGPEGQKRVYEAERGTFDGRHGEAFEVRILFLRAAMLTNPLNPRTFEDAERELAKLRREIREESDFQRLASLRSEDPQSRGREGLLGWVARGDERLPPELVHAVFQAGEAELAPDRRLVGPIRTSTGMLLAWIRARRSAPPWEEMQLHVHRELRKRCMDEALEEKDVHTFLDTD